MSATTTSQCSVERTAHSYAGSLHLLPSDEEERQRLLISFSDKDDVLDIGTGRGAWLCDVRTHLPDSVQLFSIDIEPRLFPSYTALSANVHLSLCSATSLPPYWSSKFTLVHQRLLICTYTRDQWQRSIDEMYRSPRVVSGLKTTSHVLFMDAFLGSKGMLLRYGVYIADMVKATGFIDVKSEEVVMNLGKWAGKDGGQGGDVTISAWRGMRDSVMRAGGLGQFASAEEFDKALDDNAEEWDNVEGSHTALRVCYGRKPL
ncbi:hypothetical protein OG21DRAFT_1508234 [Imleria badia]|nr:hypothetical protein OG21DRAFT_1508234 [Imleria badia]